MRRTKVDPAFEDGEQETAYHVVTCSLFRLHEYEPGYHTCIWCGQYDRTAIQLWGNPPLRRPTPDIHVESINNPPLIMNATTLEEIQREVRGPGGWEELEPDEWGLQ